MQLHQLDMPQDDASDLAQISFASEHFIQRLMGAAKVYVQFFRGLPVRVRVRDQRGEHVSNLPERFQLALAHVLKHSGANVQREGAWSFYGYRHGSLQEAGDVVIAELNMAIDDDDLIKWTQGAVNDCEISLVHSIYSVAFLESSPHETYLA